MGKQTGRVLLALATVAAVLGADWHFRNSARDAANADEIGRQALNAGDYQRATAELGGWLRARPGDASARLTLGRAYEGLGWLDEADKQFEMSAEKAAENLRESYERLAKLAEKRGNADDAKRYLRAAKSVQ